MSFTYDGLDRTIKIIIPDGGETSYSYEGVSNLIATLEALGNETLFDYTAEALLEKVVYSNGAVHTLGYDLTGNLTQETDGEGYSKKYGYDKVSRLTSVTDQAGNKTLYNYDNQDNLTAVKDALGQTTRYSYDKNGNIIQETDPLGNKIQYEYTLEGWLEKTIKADGTVLTYTHDKTGTIKGQQANGENIQATTYNEIGELVTTTGDQGESQYQYNDKGQLVSLTNPRGEVTAYEYNEEGLKTALVYPSGDRVTYGYDNMNRLITLTDMEGNITTYQYDSVGNSINQQTTGDTSLAFGYTYNLKGQMIQEERQESLKGNQSEVTSNYTYDPLGQLTDFQNTKSYSESYSYDKVGNMKKKVITQSEAVTTLTMSHNKGNQLTKMQNDKQAVTYKYDKNGNLIEKTLGKDVDTYTYNALDQLTAFKGYDGFTQSYSLDGYGLRTQQVQTGNTNRLTLEEMLQGLSLADVEKEKVEGTVTTDYVYDYTLPYGQLISETQKQGSTTSTTQYVYGLERISALNSTSTSGNTKNDSTSNSKTQYVYDGRTSVVQTITKGISGSNNIAEGTKTPQITSIAYTPFGEQMGGTKVNGFAYNGEYYDAATGMINLRARQYEPAINRFSQKDMLKGSITTPLSQNRYGYVINDPMNLVDPGGKMKKGMRIHHINQEQKLKKYN